MSAQFGTTLDRLNVVDSSNKACMKLKSYCESGAKILASNIDLAITLAFRCPWILSKVNL